MRKFWYNLTFFWKVYLSAIVLIIAVVFVAEFAEDAIPYFTDYRRLNQSELETLLNEYAESGEDKAVWRERLKRDGIWLFDAPLAAISSMPDSPARRLRVIDMLPEIDDLEDEWAIVEKQLPDGRLIAMGLPEPSYSDALDAVLWMIVIAFFAGGACYCLSKFLTSRLRDISRAARQLANGDMKSRVEVALEGGDELSDLARLFNKMANSVEQVVENERRLLYDISHELRSPLARMRLSLELLRRHDKERAESYLSLLESDVERMAVMMDAIMEQGKNASVSDELMEPFDVCELLEDAVGLANFEVHKSSSDVCCKLVSKPDGEVQLNGSQSLIEQAVHNLLSNALRYSPEGGQVDVTVGLDSGGDDGARLRITVRDYGPGVPEESLGKLFRPFYRVDESRDQDSGGVGLGLALAAQYVKLHHGAIMAENSRPGLAVHMVFPFKTSA